MRTRSGGEVRETWDPRARGIFVWSFVVLVAAVVLAGFTGWTELTRGMDPFAAAERACARVSSPAAADSPERHACLEREMNRGHLRAFVPPIAIGVMGAGGMIYAAAVRRGRG